MTEICAQIVQVGFKYCFIFYPHGITEETSPYIYMHEEEQRIRRVVTNKHSTKFVNTLKRRVTFCSNKESFCALHIVINLIVMKQR